MRFIALLLLAAAPLLSQGAAAQDFDIPGRVGRISFTEGSVAVYQDPDIGWESASVNVPITSENSLWTEPRARAEMRVSAVALRLDEATQLDIARLDDDELHASLVRGSIAVRIRHNEYGSRFVFDTPEARFTVTREGRYRIDVDTEAQETRLAVFAGEASIETSQGVRKVASGRVVRIAGGDYFFERVYATDFDRWTQARDRDWVEGNATRYVSTFMTGYEQLDSYGQWIQEPGYGTLWMPTRVAADWVPYRYGRWSYVRPWGWTWIDDQPWGYAPFHYGRWVHVRDRWAWYPGRREARPAWAPALVAWVGGSNWSVGVSSGSPVMGWYPLAPTEQYRPWYRANDRYVTRVNSIVIANGSGDNRERRSRHDVNRTMAVTAVTRENLIERRPVQQSMVRINQEAVRSAPAVQPQAVMPSNTEIQRMRAARARTAPASVAAPAAQMPTAPSAGSVQPGQRQQAAQPPAGNAAISRGERRGEAPATPPLTAPQVAPGAPIAPIARPNFERRQAAPAPAPATAAPAQAAPQGQPAQPGQSQGNPMARGRERADQVHERNQQRQQEQQQQFNQQQLQQQQEAQRRAAEAQRTQQQQQEAQRLQQQQQQFNQQQLQQQQEAQRRAAEAQRAQQQQQEAQRLQQQQQQFNQQQLQQQQEAQRRAAEAQRAQEQEARRAQQQQQQQLQQQQEAQRRAAEAQQRAQQQQQEAQQRAQQQQQEAQRRAAEAQQRAQQQQGRPLPPPAPAAPQPAPQATPQAAPQPVPQAAPPAANPASRGDQRRARPQADKPDDGEKDKDKDNKGKGRGSGEGG